MKKEKQRKWRKEGLEKTQRETSGLSRYYSIHFEEFAAQFLFILKLRAIRTPEKLKIRIFQAIKLEYRREEKTSFSALTAKFLKKMILAAFWDFPLLLLLEKISSSK